MVLVIPAQPATSNEERRAMLLGCYRDGSLLLEAKDSKKPARFYINPKDIFPWDQFLPKLLVNWQLSEFKDVPKEFKPQKRILYIIFITNQDIDFVVFATIDRLKKQFYFASIIYFN
jgi:hypothetical protein